VKRFWSFKRGEQFFVGCSKLTKTGFLGCSDSFGNLYLVLPWTKFQPYAAGIKCASEYVIQGCHTGRTNHTTPNIHGT
jgi:hypothetical protein